jgi:hypothetical protein
MKYDLKINRICAIKVSLNWKFFGNSLREFKSFAKDLVSDRKEEKKQPN